MNVFYLARHPTPDDSKAVEIASGPAETARDRESTSSLETLASSIEAHREASSVVMMSSEAPVSAPVTTAPAKQTDGDLTEMQSPRPLRGGTHISGDQDIGQPSLFELDATVASKTVSANGNLKAYQPGSASQRPHVTTRVFRDGRVNGPLSQRTTVVPPLRFRSTTPTTVLHHPNTPDANKRRSPSEGSEGDPFWSDPKTSATTIGTPSPSITRLRSSQLEGSPGLLGLHDTQQEILSLLNKLQSAHIAHTNKEVEAALERCQSDLRARSKDKTIGSAEGNILDREAARIARVGGTPTKPARETTEDAALLRSIRRELTRLVEDARDAMDAAAQAKSQAAASSSATRETKGYIPYRVDDDGRVAALNSENLELRSEVQGLKKQVEQLRAEKEQAYKEGEQARKEKSDLFSKVDRLTDEVKAYRRDTPWEKDWNVGDRKSG
ncbi:hypothetical protein DHEL01_v206792 [Diaporthe helianthi]|uniref:Uncharacterized protein n=1 Tax=Diaporthe helianthi TaxID=158607 RepID=A0A2P5HX43_DIAHE|nr:hypothetical protein DHEL01_v206792 [Diaporthe helianthi]